MHDAMPTADRAVPICDSQTLARIRKTFRTFRSRDDWHGKRSVEVTKNPPPASIHSELLAP